jgi:hypothetical protein
MPAIFSVRYDEEVECRGRVLSDGEALTSGHGKTEKASEEDEVRRELDKLEAVFQFDSSGKVKLRDDFLGFTVFKSRSKADPGPRRCEFQDGAITTYNLVEPVSVLWSSRRWDADSQRLLAEAPAENGFEGPFQFVVTRGKKLAITGMKDGRRQIVWYQNPE